MTWAPAEVAEVGREGIAANEEKYRYSSTTKNKTDGPVTPVLPDSKVPTVAVHTGPFRRPAMTEVDIGP
jgi:hypothetical protein